ncbi:hypothetical protein [Spirosoma utsteinense]|uniref:Lipoprotein n=1 Tax=Spirosoma utsteinense TaxID=2585773 RepID=A0ABR6W5L4_9BACT|nr:hypothetical protein [Spirosoma utsteinense]MBC3786261.1 hypothetical protein [Spirosoma utsteinense]MBC3791887.1 hypothetical protein [Spirosoma utsteinense]
MTRSFSPHPASYLSARLVGFGFFLTLFLIGCQEKEVAPDPSTGLSDKIQRIVPRAILDDLKAKGLVINEGTQPPQLAGIFIASPYTLLSPYGTEDSWTKGKVISDYKFKFYDQSGDEVKLDVKQSSETATGLGSYVSGFGNKFTIFAETKGVQSGIQNTQLSVISGELSNDGIINFQYAFTFTAKTGDASNSVLIPVGKARIWEDGDKLASETSSFRMAALDAVEPAVGNRAGAAGSTH